MIRTIRFFNRENIFAAAFFVILLSLLYLAVSLLSPFLGDFFWALILALSFYPLNRRLRDRIGGKGTLAAFAMTLLVLVCLVLPGFFVLMNLGKEARRTYQVLSCRAWNEDGRWITERLKRLYIEDLIEKWGVESEQAEAMVRNSVESAVRGIQRILLDTISQLLKNLALLAVHIFFVSVALFFFFRDGASYGGKLVELLPLEAHHKEAVMRTFSRTVSAVVRGTFLTAAVQGLLAGVGFAVAGVPVPVLLGLLTSVNSCIPFLGATSVWLPAAVWLIAQGQYIPGFGLALWGALVVSVVDNIIKPWIIGGETRVPVFLLFFTILGGLKVYGILGVFLGPIIISLGLAFLTIYREVYLRSSRDRGGDHTPGPGEGT